MPYVIGLLEKIVMIRIKIMFYLNGVKPIIYDCLHTSWSEIKKKVRYICKKKITFY